MGLNKAEILNIVNEPSKHIQIVKIDGKDSIVYSSKFVKLLELISTMLTKDEVAAMFSETQLEIKELWDSRYDVWLDNQYYIGKSDTLGEVDEIIQQKINSLKED